MFIHKNILTDSKKERQDQDEVHMYQSQHLHTPHGLGEVYKYYMKV